jgi:retron-type reverse transcriptase
MLNLPSNYFSMNYFLNREAINVREYQVIIIKRKIQRNWQHRKYKTKKNKAKTQHKCALSFLSSYP